MRIDSISFNLSPWLLLFILPILAVIIVPFLLLPNKKKKTPKRIIPVILHSLICIGTMLTVCGMEISAVQTNTSIMILVDESFSTTSVRDDIKEYVDSLYDNKRPGTSLGLITYGGDAEYQYRIGEVYRGQKEKEVQTYATNLANALTEASESFGELTKNRIIVLSDGKDTEGNVEPIIAELKDKGVRIDTVFFDSSLKTSEVQLSSVKGNATIVKDKKNQITIDVDSNVETSAVLEIKDNDNVIATQTISINKGTNTFTKEFICRSLGKHTFKVSLKELEKDTMSENNSKSFVFNVEEKQSILIITRSLDEARAIENETKEQADVTVVLEKNAPTTIGAMISYDEVILVNVSTTNLPKDFDKIAEQFVKEEGKTILTIGGSATYFYGGMTQKDNAFNNMLPVNCDINKGQGSICLMLVIDTSTSMVNNGNRAQMAKEGAIKCVDALNDEDMIGVLSFNGSVTVNVPIQSAKMKDTVKQKINALTNARGTRLYPAMEEAKRQMTNFHTLMSKHVILLSDGNPTDNKQTADYEAIAREMLDNDISISTISIGTGEYGDLMSKIAAAGGGRNYQVNDSSDLPDIMLQETNMAQQEIRVLEEIVPSITCEDALFEGVNEANMPKLTGYVASLLKDGSTCPLKSPIDDYPIYAYKKYGKGIVASFLSDLTSNKWGQEWVSSDEGKKLIKNMCLENLPSFRRESSLSVEVSFGGNLAKLNIHTLEKTKDTIRVSTYDGSSLIEEVDAIGTNNDFSCEIKYSEGKTYKVVIKQLNYRGKDVDSLTFNLAPDYSLEYDAFGIDGELNLSNIARLGGGKLFDDLGKLNEVKMEEKIVTYNPTSPIMIITLVLIVVDLFVRFVRIQDIKKLFAKKAEA